MVLIFIQDVKIIMIDQSGYSTVVNFIMCIKIDLQINNK